MREHDGFEVLGRTLDDAAGEAFDKGARMLGLGYPGGAALERLAAERRSARVRVSAGPAARPRWAWTPAAFARSLDFSFAGLKTALLYRCASSAEPRTASAGADLAASYQAAIVEQPDRARRAGARAHRPGSARRRRRRRRQRAAARRLRSSTPPCTSPTALLCTDNAAMIASAARFAPRAALPGLPRARRLRDRRAPA